MSNVILLDSKGNPYNVATQDITRDGVTEKLELIAMADAISGLMASITAAGTNGVNAFAIQGLVGAIPVPVNLNSNGANTALVKATTVATTPTQILAANPLRLAFKIVNSGPSVIYIIYGLQTVVADQNGTGGLYSDLITPGGGAYEDDLPWRGPIWGIVGLGATPSLVISTDITP